MSHIMTLVYYPFSRESNQENVSVKSNNCIFSSDDKLLKWGMQYIASRS